ncbi:hypothetical protein [Niveibacterium sp.]|uniref:hypothetical protein n=1 Tax=Niveibacterium sp. TaxID=2017444 RepID=UPI0035B2B216
MGRLAPVAWVWTGPGRRVQLESPSGTRHPAWKPLYEEAHFEAEQLALRELSETVEALESISVNAAMNPAALHDMLQTMKGALATLGVHR